ncbi:hypothetical protein CTI12_AA472830 [Artemisia annua]|uniref:DUF538 domain-containing protein n=1 Tax=Artemisia annua TaxID=35608 RepID=A0A2U1LMG3_ARTAN|nr:hypothetical protein CTI12_AA472830 [Artemisia annua]
MALPPATLLSLILITTITTTTVTALTAYEAVIQYDFPPSLLPVGVTGYTLNKATGAFEVYLPDTCSYTVEGYNVKYQSYISGIISKDKVTKLKGVNVKVLFFWLDIVEVTRDGDRMYFSVGIASAWFDIGRYVESPQCGCGFDCNKVVGVIEVKDDHGDNICSGGSRKMTKDVHVFNDA